MRSLIYAYSSSIAPSAFPSSATSSSYSSAANLSQSDIWKMGVVVMMHNSHIIISSAVFFKDFFYSAKRSFTLSRSRRWMRIHLGILVFFFCLVSDLETFSLPACIPCIFRPQVFNNKLLNMCLKGLGTINYLIN